MWIPVTFQERTFTTNIKEHLYSKWVRVPIYIYINIYIERERATTYVRQSMVTPLYSLGNIETDITIYARSAVIG